MKTKKQLIRLTEADLHKVIKESVKKVITEMADNGSTERLQSVFDAFIKAGVKDVTNERDSKMNADGSVELNNIKPYLSVSGYEKLIRDGFIYNWFIEIDNRLFCSRHNFDDLSIAERNCNKYLKLLNGIDFDAYIESFYKEEEDGKYYSDTMLVCEIDEEDGTWFWMD